ncbi:MAG TPA: bifunctional precorrin-2 dehydrogenase/sirohydrochlorin ferrochelatase, partial [Polyangiaceae bacterium]
MSVFLEVRDFQTWYGQFPTEMTAKMTEHTQSTAKMSTAGAQLYPVFLKLEQRRVLVVGGGTVASSKLGALTEAGAVVTVVAPQIAPEIVATGARCIRRTFRSADLDGVWYVVAAAPPTVNRQVEHLARKRRLFVNAVDDAAHASSYLGGVVRKGGVTLAVSTTGRLPALAGLLREALDELLPEDIDRWVSAGQAARQLWRQNRVAHSDRRPLLLRVLCDLYGRVDHSVTPDAVPVGD